MDPLRACIALCPIAVYLLVMGCAQLGRKPFVTTGARDAAAVAIGASGLMVIGPMELFFPESAAIRFGGYAWLLLLAFYGLCVSLVVLLMRPRIVVYNATMENLRPILASAVAQMDNKARWVGDTLVVPSLAIHLSVEGSHLLRSVQLVAIGSQQNYEGWRKLEKLLRQSLKGVRSPSSLMGVVLVSAAAAITLGIGIWMASQPQTVARVFTDMVWR